VNHFSAPLTISEFIDQRQLAQPFTMPHTWRWTPEHLREVVPDHSIEIMGGRDSNPNYEMQCDSHKAIDAVSQLSGLDCGKSAVQRLLHGGQQPLP
jgi:hypothetical protein